MLRFYYFYQENLSFKKKQNYIDLSVLDKNLLS